jgi:glycosyltransferase involved in cell wall biosynthesis
MTVRMNQRAPTSEHQQSYCHEEAGLIAPYGGDSSKGAFLDILLVGPVPPPLGGIGVHISRLTRILHEAGFRVGVLNHFSSTESPFVIAALRKNPYNYFRYLRKYSAHLIHYHHSRWIQLFVVALFRNKNSKYLVTIHAGEIEKQFPQISSRGIVLRNLTIWALRRFDIVIVVNQTIASYFDEHGIHPHVELIPAFISSDAEGATLPYDSKLTSFLEFGVVITASAYRVQFLPDGSEVYGIDTLVDAFLSVSQANSDLRVVIFLAESPTTPGPQRHLAALERRLEDHDVRDRVLIVYGLEFVPALSKSALFVRPTRADGDALSIREAQEAGVPVIATDVIPRPPGVTTFATGDAAQLSIEMSRVLKADQHDTPEKSSGPDDAAPLDFSGELVRLYRAALGLPRERSHPPPAPSQASP